MFVVAAQPMQFFSFKSRIVTSHIAEFCSMSLNARVCAGYFYKGSNEKKAFYSQYFAIPISDSMSEKLNKYSRKKQRDKLKRIYFLSDFRYLTEQKKIL